MASPLGFIVAIGRLNWYRRVGEPREWFERIFVDFGQPGSQNHMETLTLTDIVTRDEITHKPLFCEPQLDLFKDYLPKFDYLFVTGAPPEDVDITDAADRLHNISVTKHFSRILIEYLKKNNINIPIHWYIAPEANLDSFISVEPQDNWKK